MAKESYKDQEKRHVRAMEKAGVSKKIVNEEKKEAGLRKGGAVKKYAFGGAADASNEMDQQRRFAANAVAAAQRAAMSGPASRLGTAVSPDEPRNMRGVGGMPMPPSTMPIRPPGMKKGGKVAMPAAKEMGKLGMARGGNVKSKAPAKKMRGGGMCK